MPGAVIIRKMAPKDIATVARLESRSFTVPWPEALLEDCLNSRIDKVWVLEESDHVSKTPVLCGYCNFRIIAGEGELMRIAVAPEFRGRGYARNLMGILVADARQNQVSAITLEVRSSNLSAINLYKSYGFVIEAVRRNYYTKPVEDGLIMWRRHI